MTERQDGSERGSRSQSDSSRRIATYIAEMVEEMERLARRERMELVGDRLSAAAREARRMSLSG